MLLKLDSYEDILSFCRVDSAAAEICNDPYFWRLLLRRDIDPEILSLSPRGIDPKRLYRELITSTDYRKAIVDDRLDLLLYMKSKGVEMDLDGEVYTAVKNSAFTVLPFLLHEGSRVYPADVELAVKRNNPELVKRLLEYDEFLRDRNLLLAGREGFTEILLIDDGEGDLISSDVVHSLINALTFDKVRGEPTKKREAGLKALLDSDRIDRERKRWLAVVLERFDLIDNLTHLPDSVIAYVLLFGSEEMVKRLYDARCFVTIDLPLSPEREEEMKRLGFELSHRQKRLRESMRWHEYHIRGPARRSLVDDIVAAENEELFSLLVLNGWGWMLVPDDVDDAILRWGTPVADLLWLSGIAPSRNFLLNSYDIDDDVREWLLRHGFTDDGFRGI